MAHVEPIAWEPLPQATEASLAEASPLPDSAETAPPLPLRRSRGASGSPNGDVGTPRTLTEQDSELKFEAARAKAEKLGGVHRLTQNDIEGLSYDQLRQLRGY
jgi:hypothetical protein